ncbi:hypothetical protein WA026_009837 [Henosepilachna vigintioctopunctata]|uniref:C2H2-type domain-containing protein n=1 Tax=Henosepilachna vigintioctopunctata TaxID=420089 RepID=A0AAW1TL28_9CUCU
MENRKHSENALRIKEEPEENLDGKFGANGSNLNLNAWLDLPIPFKVEPDSEERSTQNYLDEVSAVVNANIAQIGEDLIDTNSRQLTEARLQMEALQRTLLGEKLRDRRFKEKLCDKKSKTLPTTSKEESDKTEATTLEPTDNDNSNSDCNDDDDDLPKCSVCKRVYNDDDSLREHFRNRKPGIPFGCCACGKVFRDNTQLNIHFRTHTGEKPFACKQCDKKFSIKGNLNKHMRTHTGERRFECKTCNKKFMQFAHLDDHIKTHTGERPFNCDECHSAFKTKALLKKHKRNHDEKSVRKRCVRCRICGKVMKTSKQLYGHMKLHSDDEEPFKCEVCGKVYKSLFYLQSHQKMHEGIKPYKCSVCEKAFVISSQLRRHENSHAGFKPFQCEICFRPFGVLQNLKRHLLTHSGDKPYSCATCGKSFLTFENMNRHTRTHTGEKPFSCDICGRRFAHSTTVKEHRRTHTGDKPYGCSICNKRFPLNKVLYKHMRTRHSEYYETFEKVNDIPRQVRMQVAHNFDRDEYQEPDYIESSDILSNCVKMEPLDDNEEEDVKPFKVPHARGSSLTRRDTNHLTLVKSEEEVFAVDFHVDECESDEDQKPQIDDIKPYLENLKKETDTTLT